LRPPIFYRGGLEQIKFLLGHSSIQTTERYLGPEQEIVIAVNKATRTSRCRIPKDACSAAPCDSWHSGLGTENQKTRLRNQESSSIASNELRRDAIAHVGPLPVRKGIAARHIDVLVNRGR
jgi:hypothetical protein